MGINLQGITEKYLQENKYDGLCNDTCGCLIGDLMPCGEPLITCEPGYKILCPGPEDCEIGGEKYGCKFHISAKKSGD